MMKAKIFTLILLTAILSLAVVSAASLGDISDVIITTPINHDDGTFTFTFDLVNTAAAATLAYSTTTSDDLTVTFSHNSIGDGSSSSFTQTVTATVSFDSNQNGVLEGTIEVDPSGTGSVSKSFDFSVNIIDEASISVEDSTITTADTTATITIINTGNIDLTNVLVEVEDANGLVFGDVATFDLIAGASVPKEVDVTISPSSLDIGTNDAIITVTAGTETATGQVILEKEYCEIGNIGVLEIDRLKFTNNGIGDKDEWYLTDEIEVEVKIENTDKDNDVDDVIVEWGLYDKDSGDFIFDDEENEFNLDDDESETLNFKFTLDPEEFDEDYGENDFVFYIKAYSDDDGEDVQCIAETETDIQIMRDDNFVLVEGIELTADTLPCGEELSGSFKAWNVGEEEEEDAFVMITNEELEINEKINIGDIDVLEDVKRTFSFMIPADASEKSYYLRFTVYDEDGDVFENNEDDEAVFSKLFNVEGQCKDSVIGSGDLIISAVNSPETPKAVPGKQYIIQATLTNTGDTKETYGISAFGNTGWSTLASIDPQLVILDAGESRDVNIILNLDEGAEGDKVLTIKASSGDKEVEQRVGLTIESSNGPELDAFSNHIKNNWFIYVIVLINIILIIAIILVIRSMIKPREAY